MKSRTINSLPGNYVRAALVLGLIVMLLIPATQFASARPEGRYNVYLKTIICDEETNEVGADWIYAMVIAANLDPRHPQVGRVFLAGEWRNFDQGESKNNPNPTVPIWGPQPFNPAEVLIMVMLMESDRSGSYARESFQNAFDEGVAAYVQARRPRITIIEQLKRDIRAKYRHTSGGDDIIDIQELTIISPDVEIAESTPVSKIVQFRGDGGRYRILFEFRKEVIVTIPVPAPAPAAARPVSRSVQISSLSPTEGPPGSIITIRGQNFGGSSGTKIVSMNRGGSYRMERRMWSDRVIRVVVPEGLAPGEYRVVIYMDESHSISTNPVSFRVTSSR